MTTQPIETVEERPRLDLVPPLDGPWLADPVLYYVAEGLNDVENARKANANRLEVMTRPVDKPDADGVCRGLGITEDHPLWFVVEQYQAAMNDLSKVEKQMVKTVEGRMKENPLAPWLESIPGVGWKTGGRLLAVIGDPYWNTLYDRPRTESELIAYCGYHVDRETHVAPRRTKGKRANWNNEAKMRTRLIAESLLKQKGAYYDLYLARRAATVDRVHEHQPCVRCGPPGKPAAVGTPWSKAHQHADGLRVVSKHFLRALWAEARRLHLERLAA